MIDLDEARAIKAETLGQARGDHLSTTLDRTYVWTEEVERRRIQPKLAVGIAGDQRRGYRLQARLQDRSAETFAALDRLHQRARGEVDVIEIGVVVALMASGRRRARPLERGLSIGLEGRSTGTLGAFVRDRAKSGELLILSNNHVLADIDRVPEKTPIIQPGRLDGGTAEDAVARLARTVPLARTGANRVDAAIATVTAGVEANLDVPSRLSGTVDRTSDPVQKIGRTTGVTSGRVTTFELDNVTVTYPDRHEYRFDGQLEITGSNARFSQGGDSGSLVTAGSLALGLVFAGTNSGGPGNIGQTYANPIDMVLSALAIELVL